MKSPISLRSVVRQLMVGASALALVTGVAMAAPQADEATQMSQKAKAEAAAQKKAEKKAEKEAAKKAKTEAAAKKKAEKADKEAARQAKRDKNANTDKAQIANTPKGTYLPGQFTEQERKAAPAQEVKQF